MLLLALDANAFHMRDEHLGTGDIRVKSVYSNFTPPPHTHTAIYQRLPSRVYVEMIAIVTAVYLLNKCCHFEEIQKVYRGTTASSFALNWSSRPNK